MDPSRNQRFFEKKCVRKRATDWIKIDRIVLASDIDILPRKEAFRRATSAHHFFSKTHICANRFKGIKVEKATRTMLYHFITEKVKRVRHFILLSIHAIYIIGCAQGQLAYSNEHIEQFASEQVVEQILAGGSVYVNRFILSGNTVLADSELSEHIRPYIDRDVRYEDITELRDKLTLAYVDRGYISSGAVLDLNTLHAKILSIQIIEGSLTELRLKNKGRLRDHYLKSRIVPESEEVVNIFALEKRLQILERSSRVSSIQSELLPGEQRGDSILNVEVQEARPYGGQLEISNYEPPNVGSARVLLGLSHQNLTGFADTLGLETRQTEGLSSWSIRYSVPISRHDAQFFIDAQKTDSRVVEEDFSALDINTSSENYSIGVEYPVYRTANSRIGVSFSLNKKQSNSFLLGQPFSFSEAVENGIAEVDVVKTGIAWNQSNRQRAISVSAKASFGENAKAQTEFDNGFVKLLGQFQWVQRFSLLESQTIARVDVQLTDSELLGLEKYSIGGHNTVRGYRENTFTGDTGWLASFAWRIPIQLPVGLFSQSYLIPFVDAGAVKNNKDNEQAQKLVSIGLGAQFSMGKYAIADFQWANRLNRVVGDGDLQDSGVHASIRFNF